MLLTNKPSSEDTFRRAFERLKSGTTQILPAGSAITQNNVAREAGKDPSALKKSRHPELIDEIQKWVIQHTADRPLSERQHNIQLRNKARSLREKMNDIKRQRDTLASLLVEADAKILELTMDNLRLQALLLPSTVTSIGLPIIEKPR
ncbi:hypothetical protein ACIUX8_00510 [Pseudomonas aeruginosa]